MFGIKGKDRVGGVIYFTVTGQIRNGRNPFKYLMGGKKTCRCQILSITNAVYSDMLNRNN